MKLLATILIVLYILPPIVTRHDKDEHQFIVNPSDYPAVIQLRLRDLTGSVEMEGTLIAPNWIVTAAHGLNSVEANQTLSILDSLYQITQIISHPSFDGFEHDIALINLDKKIVGVQPIPLYRDTNELGKQITIMGRGGSGTGQTGPHQYDSKFRIATNKIDSVSSHWIKFRFDEPSNPNTTDLEGISGPGDSGGPAFIEIAGQKYLAGISSNQLNEQIGAEEGQYGVIEYYTRVSSYIQWIEDAIEGKIQVQSTFEKTETNWGFPDTEIGKKATEFMDAIASNHVTDEFMERVFYQSFRESFDLKGFVQGISNNLANPQIGEIRKAKNNVLIFTVLSEGKTFLIQLEADKRDKYLIGGLFYKKIDK